MALNFELPQLEVLDMELPQLEEISLEKMAAGEDLIGPVITRFGEKFHMDLCCPTLHRSRKFRRVVCRSCGLRRSINEAQIVVIDQAKIVHTDCPLIGNSRD